MGKLKWVTKNVSCSCHDPPQIHQKHQLSVSFSCYPFSLTRFGATDQQGTPALPQSADVQSGQGYGQSPYQDSALQRVDSSIILSLRGGIVVPTGSLPESLGQAILVGTVLVGRSGVWQGCKGYMASTTKAFGHVAYLFSASDRGEFEYVWILLFSYCYEDYY